MCSHVGILCGFLAVRKSGSFLYTNIGSYVKKLVKILILYNQITKSLLSNVSLLINVSIIIIIVVTCRPVA
jgi:hypothetical protein